MPLSSIVIIVIRLFVLNSLLHDLTLWTSILLAPLSNERSASSIAMLYAPAVLLLVVISGLWILAPWIARLVSRGADATISLPSLSRYDLYSFAFVFLGLLFVLSSIAEAINWLHYLATVFHDTNGQDPRVQNLYQLTRAFLTLAAGLVSLLGAPRWTKKLLAYEQKHNVA